MVIFVPVRRIQINRGQRRSPPLRTIHYEDRIILGHMCNFSGPWIERNPLFLAVLKDELETLKNLLRSAKMSVNRQNSRGRSLLNFVIKLKRVDIFDYLLSLEQTDVNYEDRRYGTPLLCVASNFHEDFALKLIEKGADVHRTGYEGNTFLHIAAQKEDCNNLSIGKIIIEKGIDINHQASSSNTPLYEACRCRNFEWIYMLLYYGADARIHREDGELPLTSFTDGSPNEPDEQLLEEILFNHTFDVADSFPLRVVSEAMSYQPSLFCKMLHYIEDVIYDEEDIEDMANKLVYVNSENFKLFFEKFGYVVEELDKIYPLLDFINHLCSNFHYLTDDEIKEIIETVLRSKCVEKFVQSASSDSIISTFVKLYAEDELSRLTEIVCLMLSYGLRVTSADLDAVYDRYGFCELFKILLHMDVETDKFLEDTNHKHLMAAIFYQPQMTIENILERMMLYPDLLLYFNHPKLKEYINVGPSGGQTPSFENTLPRLSFLEKLVKKKMFGSRGIPYEVGNSLVIYTCEDQVAERVKQLPNVPCLVELSRNAARRHIIERFRVKNCRQFYTVIQHLPISTTHKDIISLEKMLY